MIWRFNEKRYVQVKNTSKNPNIATKHVRIDVDSDYDETMRIMSEQFFPDGKSCKGKFSSYHAQIGNVKGKPVNKINFTLREWLSECKTQKARLYLLLKKKVSMHTLKTELQRNGACENREYFENSNQKTELKIISGRLHLIQR